MTYDRRWLDDAHVGDHVGRAIWALGDVLDHSLGAGARRPGAATARCARALVPAATCRCAPRRTPRSASPGSTQTGSTPDARELLERCVTQLEAAYEATAGPGWSWFEDSLRYDNARVPQALILGGVALGRAGRRPRRGSLRSPGSVTSAGSRTACCGCPATTAATAASRRPAAATSSRSTRRRSSKPSCRRSPSPATSSTACARSARSSGSSAGTGSAGRSTTSPPEAAATVSATDDVNANEGAESTLAFHRAQLVLDAAGLPRVVRAAVSRKVGRVTTKPEPFRRHPANPILTAADWPHSVNAVFNPAAVADRRRDRAARPRRGAHRHLAPHGRAIGQRRRQLAGRRGAAARAGRQGTTRSSGASRTPARSGSTSSTRT